jgi:hypothetical protein
MIQLAIHVIRFYKDPILLGISFLVLFPTKNFYYLIDIRLLKITYLISYGDQKDLISDWIWFKLNNIYADSNDYIILDKIDEL